MPHAKSKDGWLSVTEVLSLSINKPFLNYWYGKLGTEMCEQVKRDSQELGIAVHDAIEKRFNGEEVPGLSDNAKRMLENFWNKFVIPWEAKPVILEQTYENEKLKLQGTLDAVLRTNKGLFLVDFKTSNQLDKTSIPLQLAAYAFLNGENIKNGLAVRIDKEKDTVQIKEYEDIQQYVPLFMKAMELARFIKYGEIY